MRVQLELLRFCVCKRSNPALSLLSTVGCEVFHNLKKVIKAKFGGDATLSKFSFVILTARSCFRTSLAHGRYFLFPAQLVTKVDLLPLVMSSLVCK